MQRAKCVAVGTGRSEVKDRTVCELQPEIRLAGNFGLAIFREGNASHKLIVGIELKLYLLDQGIGTTNYNSLVPEVAEGALSTYQVEHLNGSVHDFYDPYLNTIVHFTDDNECLNYERITVPLMFTQSGIKPLTCIEMSKRYVGLYDSFCDSDAVVVGFGFNGDDGHVNGLFRNLIDECNKDIYICHYQSNGSDSAAAKNYERKLRITNRDRLHIIGVNDERKTLNGDFWYESIAKAIIG